MKDHLITWDRGSCQRCPTRVGTLTTLKLSKARLAVQLDENAVALNMVDLVWPYVGLKTYCFENHGIDWRNCLASNANTFEQGSTHDKLHQNVQDLILSLVDLVWPCEGLKTYCLGNHGIHWRNCLPRNAHTFEQGSPHDKLHQNVQDLILSLVDLVWPCEGSLDYLG